MSRIIGFDEKITMLDHYRRDINYLRVSVTDRCNLRCVYCMPKDGVSIIGHDDILRYEEILRIIKAAVKLGIVKVRITGGEPLVRKGLLNFLRSLSGIGLKEISLTTNGTLLESFAEGILEAGVGRINVSLDSLDAVRYAAMTRGGELEAVLRGIEKAESVGLSPIKINVVAVRGMNEEDILDFAAWTLEKPYHIRFIELMPAGWTLGVYRDYYLPNDVVMKKIGERYPLEPVEGSGKDKLADGPARMYRIQGAAGRLGFISPISHLFCSSCNRLRLKADGRLRACLVQDVEVDLKTIIRAGCSDADLEDLIGRTIVSKPGNHSLRDQEISSMSSIGG
jgi:GTP 3',8-cyclase